MSPSARLLLCLVLAGCDVQGPQTSPSGYCIAMPSTLDFGETEIGLPRGASVPIANGSSEPVEVSFSALEPPFSGPRGMTFGVPAQSTRYAEFTFDAPDGLLHFTTLQFVGGAGCAAQNVTLTGLGAGLLLAPQFLRFPPVEAGSSTTVQLRIVNTRRSAVPVSIVATASADGVVHFDVPATVEIAASSFTDVPITFHAAGDGAIKASVIIESERERRVVELDAVSGVPVVALSRTRIEMNPLPLVQPSLRVVRVKNAGRGELKLDRVSVSAQPPGTPEEVEVAALSRLQPGQELEVAVRFSPRSRGHREWRLNFETNDPVTPAAQVELVAEVVERSACESGLVVSPGASLAPPYPKTVLIDFENATATPCLAEALAFGDSVSWTHDLGASDSFVVPAQSTARRTVTVTGPGSTELTFRNYRLSDGRVLITAVP